MKRMQSLPELVEAVRTTLRQKQRERNEIEQRPYSRAQVARLMEQRVLAAAERGRAAIAYDSVRLSIGDNGLTGLSAGAPVTRHGADIDMTEILAAVLGPEALLAVLLRDIENIPEGLEPEAKAKRLAELDAEIEQLGRQEETLIVEAEAQGIEILRRADADPRIVIGLNIN